MTEDDNKTQENQKVEETLASGVGKAINRAFWRPVLAVCCLSVAFDLLSYAIDATDWNRDDTDPTSGPRSGLVVLTDARTGCQYLTAAKGGITPRQGVDGFQICAKAGQ